MAFRENASDRMAGRGHEVHHQQVSGNARVHNGDNNYGINYEGVNTSQFHQQMLTMKVSY